MPKESAPPVTLDDLFAVEAKGEIVPVDPNETLAGRKAKDLEDIENDLFNKSSEVLEGALLFADLAPGATEPPEEWFARYGVDKATRLFRTAQYATMSAKEAPVGIKVAESIARGVMKARSMEKTAPKTLAVAFLNQTVHHHYDTKDVDDDER